MDPPSSEQNDAAQQQPTPTSCSRSHSIHSQHSARFQGRENLDTEVTATPSGSNLPHSQDLKWPPALPSLSPSTSTTPSPLLVHPYPHLSSIPTPSAPPPPPSPPPPAIRVHNPHTLPSPHGDTTDISAGYNSSFYHDNAKGPAMSFPSHHFTQLGGEKNGHHFANPLSYSSSPSSASAFHPIKASAAPPVASLYHHTTFPQNPNSPANHDNNAHNATAPYILPGDSTASNDQGEQSNQLPNTAISSHPQAPFGNGNVGGAASHFNIQPFSRTSENDDTSNTASNENNDHAESESVSSSSPANNSHHRPSNVGRSGSAAPRKHVRINFDKPTEPESPALSREQLTLFRRTWLSLRKHRDSRKDSKQNESKRLKLIRLARKVPFGGFVGHHKTGIPGRNGEEPETNPFKYVGIMLDMPTNPSLCQVIWKLFKVLVVFTIAYLALMSLYFAAEYNSSSRLENIDILVVDLDHSIIGNHFLNFTQQDNKLPGQVNWSIQVGYENEEEVIEDVENGYYWGAMVVRANASLMLNKGLSTPLPSYDPRKAFLFVYDGGRDPLTVKPYVIASLYTQFLQFTTNFNLAWIILVLTVAGDHVDSITPLVDAPQVLGTPVAFEELDVHPPTAPIITSATSVAYIWIFLIAGGSTYLVANAVQPLTRKASVRKTMVLLLVPLLVFLSSLSMVYTVVLRIFGVPFHSAGQFVSLFLSMLLVQASVSSLVLFLVFFIPVIFIPAITTTFVFMNVIAVFHPVELMPPFYRWAYAMPFLNAVQLARYVLMGSYNRLIYNLPILFAWIIVPLTLLPLAIARQKRLMKEVLELEEDERQDNKSRRYSSGKDRKYDDYGYTKDTGISKRRRRSHENSDSSQSDDEDDLESASGSCYRCRRRHHHHHGQRRLDRMDDEDYDNENEEEDEEDDGYAEDLAVIEHNAAVMNAARSIRPLNSSGMLTSGATPSAPPASQVLETHQLHQQQQQHHRSSNDHQRSLLETLQLSRHPYASELVQTQALDEVK